VNSGWGFRDFPSILTNSPFQSVAIAWVWSGYNQFLFLPLASISVSFFSSFFLAVLHDFTGRDSTFVLFPFPFQQFVWYMVSIFFLLHSCLQDWKPNIGVCPLFFCVDGFSTGYFTYCGVEFLACLVYILPTLSSSSTHYHPFLLSCFIQPKATWVSFLFQNISLGMWVDWLGACFLRGRCF